MLVSWSNCNSIVIINNVLFMFVHTLIALEPYKFYNDDVITILLYYFLIAKWDHSGGHHGDS